MSRFYEVTKATKNNTWLLTWNPAIYDWENIENPFDYNTIVSNTKKYNASRCDWKCDENQIKKGDRIFIIRLGQNPKGIIATGYANFYEKIHDFKIYITGIFDYHTEPIISLDLLEEKYPDQQWDSQTSKILLNPDVAKWLKEEWNLMQYKPLMLSYSSLQVICYMPIEIYPVDYPVP